MPSRHGETAAPGCGNDMALRNHDMRRGTAASDGRSRWFWRGREGHSECELGRAELHDAGDHGGGVLLWDGWWAVDGMGMTRYDFRDVRADGRDSVSAPRALGVCVKLLRMVGTVRPGHQDDELFYCRDSQCYGGEMVLVHSQINDQTPLAEINQPGEITCRPVNHPSPPCVDALRRHLKTASTPG
jgi:hypothetical protein